MHASGEEQSGPTHCTYNQGEEREAFVVRVWLEEKAIENQSALWRGHITHAVSGRRRYFQELSAIAGFIAPYLRAWGININSVTADE